MRAPDELVAEAVATAGASDFGGESWRPGLEAILDSVAKESAPSETGVAALERQAVRFLINRLEIQQWYARHPEIAEEQITSPIFSVGMVRTGTTALSFLLDQDPGNRSLLHWQAMFPCPPPEAAHLHDDPRIAQAEAEMGLTGMGTADRAVIENLPDGPAECLYLLGMDFKSGHYEGMFYVPSYHEWLFDQDLTSAYEWHRKCLKLLQWRAPTERWSLKYPSHLIDLEAITRVFPDAHFVQTHRDPIRSIASVCSLVLGTRTYFVSEPDPEYLGRQWAMIVEEQLQRLCEFRDKHGDERFIDIDHLELVSDPMGQLERIYSSLGIDVSEAARSGFQQRIASNPKGVYGQHKYDPDRFGLNVDELNERFAFYYDRFGVRREPFGSHS